MTGYGLCLQPRDTPEMRARLAKANAAAKQYAAEIERQSRFPRPLPLFPEQAAAIRAQASSAEPEAEP